MGLPGFPCMYIVVDSCVSVQNMSATGVINEPWEIWGWDVSKCGKCSGANPLGGCLAAC